MVTAFPLLQTDMPRKSLTYSVVMSNLLLSPSNAFFILDSVVFNFHLVLIPCSSAELFLFLAFPGGYIFTHDLLNWSAEIKQKLACESTAL